MQTLRGRIPVAVGVAADDPVVLAEARRGAALFAAERQVRVVSEPRYVESVEDPQFPLFVSHIFECETTSPSPDVGQRTSRSI